jgi:hypothetical protein
MNLTDFLPIMAYIEKATERPLDKERAKIYFDLLGDLPAPVLQAAAQRVVLEHPWATFPSIAELRAAAADVQRGQVAVLSGAEAWELAWKAAGRIDLDIPGSLEAATKDLPALVIETMRAFSVPALICGKEPVGVVRGQFIKMYDQLAARDQRRALLPARLQQQIESHKPALPKPAIPSLESIGKLPEEMIAMQPFEDANFGK